MMRNELNDTSLAVQSLVEHTPNIRTDFQVLAQLHEDKDSQGMYR